MSLVMSMSDQVVALDFGRKIAEGTPAEVRAHPRGDPGLSGSAGVTAALLDVANLHAGYGSTRVLHGIGFAMAEGAITALLGANGAGKTTTLRALCAMVQAARRGPLRRRAHRRRGHRGHRAPGASRMCPTAAAPSCT